MSEKVQSWAFYLFIVSRTLSTETFRAYENFVLSSQFLNFSKKLEGVSKTRGRGRGRGRGLSFFENAVLGLRLGLGLGLD